MSARDDMQRIVLTLEAKNRALFVGCAAEVQQSVTVGSERTAAPGQPVKTGALRASYTPEFIDDHTWQTSTNLPYARGIEEGVGPNGPITIRSSVGGSHSIALTKTNFDRIVAHVAAEVRGR